MSPHHEHPVEVKIVFGAEYVTLPEPRSAVLAGIKDHALGDLHVALDANFDYLLFHHHETITDETQTIGHLVGDKHTIELHLKKRAKGGA